MVFKNARFRLENIQRGVVFISKHEFEKKVEGYRERYQKKDTRDIVTNIRRRTDFSLLSLCRDKVVEDYLRSGRYIFKRIGILLNPFRFAPKTAVLLFYSENPVSVEIKVTSGKQNSVYCDKASAKQYHRLSITGLENGKNEITLSLFDENGNKINSRAIHIVLHGIDDIKENPVLKTETKVPSAYHQIFITGGGMNPFVFNANGSLFHFMKFAHFRTSTYGVYPFKQHKFLWSVRNVGAPSFANPHSALIYEMDFLGRVSRTYHVKNGMHHFVYEMPNGNLLTLSSSIENYTDRIPEGHTEDILIELERETGKIVKTVYLKDIFGTKYVDQVDWVHGNALEYNEEEDSLLICMRNIHSVIKLNWSTLEVQWLLSLPSLWEDTHLAPKVLKPIGDVHYSFQAHAAYEITDFRGKGNDYRFYMVYDNHRLNRRPVEGYQEDGHSYINIYAVNEKENTVRQMKHLQIDMSIVRSNARYDAASNRIFNMAGCMTRDHEDYRGKVEEYDYDTDKLLNRWYIKNDFFSGYDFKWNSDDYCEPLLLDENYSYVCGEADVLSPVKLRWESCADIIDTEYFDKPFVEEGYLYFYTKDHTISSLVFVGKKHCFERDYSGTWQTTPIHVNRSYYCVVSLDSLPEDQYQIKVVRDQILYETGYYIHLGPME